MSIDSFLIQAEQLTCIREDRILFDSLVFNAESGKVIQIEGPNGAGKTSLLRILAGLSVPYEGRVCFQGVDINEQPEFYHQHLLYLGHHVGVKTEFSALENLRFNLALHNVDSTNIEAALKQVGLLGFEALPAGQLSAGQQRRIALAQLWLTQAKLWILDEPFTAIDKGGVVTLEALMVEHVKQGGCVILTTHQALSIPDEYMQTVTLEYRY